MKKSKTINKYNNIWEIIRYTKLYRAPLWIYRRLRVGKSPAGQVVKMRLGHKMKIKPSEPYLKNVIYARQYHDENIFLAEKFLSENSVIIDIGANIGLYTCAYLQHYKNKKIKTYAIEAFASNYRELVQNVTLNNFTSVQLFNLAVGDHEGELAMYAESEDYVGNLAGENVLNDKDKSRLEGEKQKKFVTPMVTLDQWAQNNNIQRCDFIKIDIEGAEYFAFLGGRNFIRRTRPVIQAEFNKYWLKNANVTAQTFLDFFSDLKYCVAIEESDCFRHITSQEFIDLTQGEVDVIDILFIPNEKV
jgi:FkbM family methyltransferase